MYQSQNNEHRYTSDNIITGIFYCLYNVPELAYFDRIEVLHGHVDNCDGKI